MPYRIRPATVDDADVLVHHRIAMFADMGVALDRAAVAPAFRQWLADLMPSGRYRAWVVEETASGTIVAGGGLTVVPWPPGPRYLGGELAFVYNVYTEPTHRRRGLGRQIMDAIHAWCREQPIGLVALNSSDEGRGLYDGIGYVEAPRPMMFFAP